MLADELRDALLAVPGVASAQVAESAGAKPVVRVWLDGSRREADVAQDVDRVIVSSGYRIGEEVVVAPRPASEDSPSDEPHAGAPPPARAAPIALVAVEESSDGIRARVVSADGQAATERIRHGSRGTEEAVVAAVAALHGAVAPRVLSVEDREIEGTSVVLVVLEADSGVRVAGSAVVGGGRPFAVARAAHAALSDLR